MATQMATRQSRSKTTESVTVQPEKPSNTKEQLNALLSNRTPKETLVKKGIIQVISIH